MTLYPNRLLNKLIIIFVIHFVGVSCNKTPEYIKLAQKITFECSKDLEKTYNLRLASYGGRLMYDVEEIDAGYVAAEPLTIARAREIYVGIVQCYLNRINSDLKLRPYLHRDPFSFENLDIMLSVDSASRPEGNVEFGTKQVVLVFKGRDDQIIYETYDWEKEDYEVILEESYEEAVAVFKGMR